MASEPSFGKRLGTFEFDYMNRTSRQKVGALMTQYHGSMGDPYYAVGSFYLDHQAYPKLDVVERALGQVERDIRKADAGASGWGKQEAMELRAIKKYLEWDIARMKSAGRGRASGQSDVDARNRAASEQEIANWLASPPEKAFVYYSADMREVQNWMGVKMGDIVRLGQVTPRFGGKVQSVGVRGTNGVGYHGICNLTGGNYCRLRRVKVKSGRAGGAAALEMDPGYAYKRVRGQWETVVVSDDDSRRSVHSGSTNIDGQRMQLFRVGRTTYAQTFGRPRRR